MPQDRGRSLRWTTVFHSFSPPSLSPFYLYLSCFLALLLLLLLPSHSLAYDLLPTHTTPPVDIRSPRNPTTALTRFAYVALHYEGTPRDDEYLLGLRTTLYSLQQSGTTQDILVLLSDNVRPTTRAQLLADGVKLITVSNIQNPFKGETSEKRRRTYRPRFEFTFNKLYLWNLTQYERVVYLDSDNIVLSNPDELFMCGSFCVVYMNPLLFHTGLMVVQPDTHKFNELVQTLFSSDSYSHDGADQGFLCAVFNMEDAPLYDIKSIQKNNPPGVPMTGERVRLAIGYNLNQFWYYNYFTWDFYRHNNYYWNTFPVPGLTIAYPSAWWMKPWYWYMEAYLYHHWTWQYMRWRLEGYGQWQAVVVSRLLAAAALQLVTWMVVPLLCALRVMDGVSRAVRAVVGLHPVYVGYVVGGGCFLFSFITAFRWIPAIAPTVLAYPLFVVLHISLMWLLYYTYCQLLRDRAASINSAATAMAAFDDCVRWKWFMVFVGMHLFTFHLFHAYWLHFIIKLGALLWTLMLWVGVDAHMFRRASERMLHTKQL